MRKELRIDYSQLSRKPRPSGIEKVSVRGAIPLTRIIPISGHQRKIGWMAAYREVNILLGSQKQQLKLFLGVMLNERTASENRYPLIGCSAKCYIFVGLQ